MEKIVHVHQVEFESPPEVIVSVPCPFYLMGEHSWFFKDKSICIGTNLPVYIAVSFRQDMLVRCSFVQAKEKKRIHLHSLKYRREDRWANAIKATLAGFIENGISCQGLNITIYSEILPVTGLGIKPALRVGTALILRELFAPHLKKEKLFEHIQTGNRLCYTSPRQMAGEYAVLYAQKNTCIFTDHNTNTYEHIPFPFFNEYTIVVTDSRVPRTPLWDESDIRTSRTEKTLNSLKIKKNEIIVYDDTDLDINDVFGSYSEDMRRRLLYIVKEHQCVIDLQESLRSANFMAVARSINRSHEFLRDLYGTTCPEIDWLVKRAQEVDMSKGRGNSTCARITGKSFARCTYSIVKKEDVDSYVQKFIEYERIFGFRPLWYIAESASAPRIVYKNSN